MDWQERPQYRQLQEEVQTLQAAERLRLQTLNSQYLQRVTQAEHRASPPAVQTTAEEFARSISAELMQRRSRDALAEYLHVNPGDLRINMEDLEGLTPWPSRRNKAINGTTTSFNGVKPY